MIGVELLTGTVNADPETLNQYSSRITTTSWSIPEEFVHAESTICLTDPNVPEAVPE